MGRDAERRQVEHLGTAGVRAQLQRLLDRHGLSLDRFHLHDLQHRPGAGATGVFEVHATAPRGPEQELFIGLTAESLAEESVVPVGRAVGADWGAWFHPHDPRLPGLALAADPDSVRSLWSGGDRLTSLRTVSYRPLRRAVLRATFAAVVQPGGPTHSRAVYLKVLRPGMALPLHRRHVVLAAAGVPVAPVLGPPVAEVLALGEGPGTSLAAALMTDGASALEPVALTEALDRMPAEIISMPRRHAWADRTAAYGRAAAVALPDQEQRIRALVRELERRLESTDRGPVVPAHGDFYEANLLVDGGQVSCVLDVDGAGPGHRVDDLACFLGHLAVLPAVDRRYTHTGRALRRFHRHFAQTVDPGALACRSAAVALSLVAGARDSGRGDWRHSARARLEAAQSLLELPH